MIFHVSSYCITSCVFGWSCHPTHLKRHLCIFLLLQVFGQLILFRAQLWTQGLRASGHEKWWASSQGRNTTKIDVFIPYHPLLHYTPCKIFMAGSPKKFTPVENGKSSKKHPPPFWGFQPWIFRGKFIFRPWICLKSLWVTSFGSNPTALPWLLPISLADLPFYPWASKQSTSQCDFQSRRSPLQGPKCFDLSLKSFSWANVFTSTLSVMRPHQWNLYESFFYLKKHESHPLKSARNLIFVVTSLSCTSN